MSLCLFASTGPAGAPPRPPLLGGSTGVVRTIGIVVGDDDGEVQLSMMPQNRGRCHGIAGKPEPGFASHCCSGRRTFLRRQE
jgi:hypothetical protein